MVIKRCKTEPVVARGGSEAFYDLEQQQRSTKIGSLIFEQSGGAPSTPAGNGKRQSKQIRIKDLAVG
jgi:hypothetical protein